MSDQRFDNRLYNSAEFVPPLAYHPSFPFAGLALGGSLRATYFALQRRGRIVFAQTYAVEKQDPALFWEDYYGTIAATTSRFRWAQCRRTVPKHCNYAYCLFQVYTSADAEDQFSEVQVKARLGVQAASASSPVYYGEEVTLRASRNTLNEVSPYLGYSFRDPFSRGGPLVGASSVSVDTNTALEGVVTGFCDIDLDTPDSSSGGSLTFDTTKHEWFLEGYAQTDESDAVICRPIFAMAWSQTREA